MELNDQWAINHGYDWKQSNHYFCRGDLLLFAIIACIIVFITIFGIFYYTKVFLVLNGIIALSFSLEIIIDIMFADRLNKSNKK